jgi:hypothetical protein
MWMRHAIVLVGLLGSVCAAPAQDFRIEDVGLARSVDVAQLKPGVIAFSDQDGGGAAGEADLIHFDDWARTRPNEKKFLALFADYVEPPDESVAKAGAPAAAGSGGKPDPKPDAKPDTKSDAKSDTKSEAKAEAGAGIQKLDIYVAQARFALDKPPAAVELSRYVTLPFLERIDPAIKHKVIAATDVLPLTDQHGLGNDNPERKWCTGRAALICIESTYKLEGKIPIGILLANKLRDSAKKISDHIDFQSELSALSAADVDQAGLRELTMLDAPVVGALEQNLFHINQIMKFGKFLAVFQVDPADPMKTVVTAFMALAIEAGVLEKKKEFENVPVLRNLVPAQVLMGKSSFNSGESISAGLPKYARNEIRTIAGILARDAAAK